MLLRMRRLGEGDSLREEMSDTFDVLCMDCPKLGDWGDLYLGKPDTSTWNS